MQNSKRREAVKRNTAEYQRTHKDRARYSRLKSYSKQYIKVSGKPHFESREDGIKHLKTALKIVKGRIAQATK